MSVKSEFLPALKAPKKFDYDETAEYLNNCLQTIEDDLKHALKCLNRLPDSQLIYEAISSIDNMRDKLEELTSESFFLAHKLNKELKKNAGK